MALASLMAWPALGQADGATHTEEALVRAFLNAAPALSRRQAQRQGRKAAALVAPYLRHPELTVRREQTFGGVEFSTTVFGLALNLEVGGRHALRQRAARLDARALGHQHAAGRRRAICGLRRLVHQVHAEQAALEILARGQKGLQAVVKDVRRLVKAGERAPFERDRLLLQVEEHARGLAVRRARLSALLARLSSITGLAVRYARLAPASTATGSGEPALAAARALETRARAATLRGQAADRRWIPDLGLYAAYRLEQAPGVDAGHGYEAGLTVSLPLTDAGRVEVGRSRASRLALRSRILNLQASRRARLAALVARATTLRAAVQRPGADLAVLRRAAARRYITGVSPLSALLDALGALERVALQRAGQRAKLRRLALETACTRGTFDEPIMEKLAEVKP